jgi:phytoene synthase
MQLYHKNAQHISSIITRDYSSSFYLSTLLLENEVKNAIHGIYGFVRYADEIVDTFHDFDKAVLLHEFDKEMKQAIAAGISLNPVLHSFQRAVNEYNIPMEYIDAFMRSMRMDLEKNVYNTSDETNEYVYGSANVVGLMCLKVFCNNNTVLFDKLQYSATMLGSAFQKVNFLRDLKADAEGLGRIYFSNFDIEKFDEKAKNEIIDEIKNEFSIALTGIRELPGRSRLSVYTAYLYYLMLLRKIRKTNANVIISERIRVSSPRKITLMMRAMVEYKFRWI